MEKDSEGKLQSAKAPCICFLSEERNARHARKKPTNMNSSTSSHKTGRGKLHAWRLTESSINDGCFFAFRDLGKSSKHRNKPRPFELASQSAVVRCDSLSESTKHTGKLRAPSLRALGLTVEVHTSRRSQCEFVIIYERRNASSFK